MAQTTITCLRGPEDRVLRPIPSERTEGHAEATRYPHEQMHRVKYTKLTPEQILDKLAAAADRPTSASPLSDVLVAQSLRIVLDDGPALGYRFADRNRACSRTPM